MNINTYTAKKLGEVLAFAEVGLETMQKGKSGIINTIGDTTYREITAQNDEHAKHINALAEESGVSDTVRTKADATSEKLRNMREIYIKEDDWDDAAELMEWHGFFEGAAIVHWSLIEGVGEKLNNEGLLKLAKDGKSMHATFLSHVDSALKQIGTDKARK